MRHNSFAELLRFPSPPTERKNKPNVLGWHTAGVPHSAPRAEMTELRSADAPAQRQGEKPGQLPGPSWSEEDEVSSPSWAAQLTCRRNSVVPPPCFCALRGGSAKQPPSVNFYSVLPYKCINISRYTEPSENFKRQHQAALSLTYIIKPRLKMKARMLHKPRQKTVSQVGRWRTGLPPSQSILAKYLQLNSIFYYYSTQSANKIQNNTFLNPNSSICHIFPSISSSHHMFFK